ncbi:unnamed protein product [Periconia digitata]|uniref:Uncharacterized protein n=1 Tax=Periconia digitata TaxID=1303443 RepID=A0A9W4XQ97_9PLEO|nr:unnamed protein product [Periconia digitata]
MPLFSRSNDIHAPPSSISTNDVSGTGNNSPSKTTRSQQYELHSANTSPSPTTGDKIGWQTPTTMLTSYIAAVLWAVGHYIYCREVDQKIVKDSVSQSWNNALAILFAQGFSIALAAAGMQAFTQILWWLLRRNPMAVSKIDALFRLNISPIYLYRIDVLRVAPAMWFFALFFPLIAVITAFPPGALVIEQLPNVVTGTEKVPTIDVQDWGNGTGVHPQYSSIGKQTLLRGEYLTRPSPCGPNCTYEVEFLAPALTCKNSWPYGRAAVHDYQDNLDVIYNMANITDAILSAARYFGAYSLPDSDYPLPEEDLLMWEDDKEIMDFLNVTEKSWNETEWVETGWSGMDWNEHGLDYDYRVVNPKGGSYFAFDMLFRKGSSISEVNGVKQYSIGCVVTNATYTAQVEYINNIQNVTVDVNEPKPLGYPLYTPKSIWNDVLTDLHDGEGGYKKTIQIPTTNGFSRQDVTKMYGRYQLYAMADALLSSLAGNVSLLSQGIESTTALTETRFAKNMESDEDLDQVLAGYTIDFDLTTTIMEDLMRNVTISLLNNGKQLVDTQVTRTEFVSKYVFKEPVRLIASYCAGLGAYLILVCLGFWAMIHNGTSASTGSFLEILGTTTASNSALNRMTKEVRLGERSPKELLKLKVRFGQAWDDGSGKPFAAFGTKEETSPLRKRPSNGLMQDLR